MQKICNPLDGAWFVDDNKSTSKILTVDTSEYKLFTIEGPREIIVKRNPFSNENFATYSENGTCECGQTLDQTWKYCPKCGGKLTWE